MQKAQNEVPLDASIRGDPASLMEAGAGPRRQRHGRVLDNASNASQPEGATKAMPEGTVIANAEAKAVVNAMDANVGAVAREQGVDVYPDSHPISQVDQQEEKGAIFGICWLIVIFTALYLLQQQDRM